MPIYTNTIVRAIQPYTHLALKTSLLLLAGPLTMPALGQVLDMRFEVKANYRDSEQVRFRAQSPISFLSSIGGDSSSFIETVEEGEHAEVSLISVAGKWQFSESLQLNFKVDAIDLYDRNPTSTDNKIDIDAFFLRYGDRFSATKIPSKNSVYAQLGKFKKFEQQRERRTESYGVVSTVFNRFEDSGVETGFDLSSGFYGRLSYTTGNPVFTRDVNALAGNNGSQDFQALAGPNTDSTLNSGIATLYDAEIEDFDLSSDPELGVGLGYRWNSINQNQKIDVLAYHYQRDLSKTRELKGTFLGGDLDLFDLSEVPGAEGVRLPFSGNEKTESGLNVWYNSGDFSLFSQYVKQDLAGLDRDGFEIELSYVLDLPITITPVVRYSRLNNDFSSPQRFPTPSFQWDWRKVDYAVNIDLSDDFRVIVEYADNEVLTAGGWKDQREFLVTLRWQQSYKR